MPADQEHAEAIERSAELRVLVVEDEYLLAEHLAEFLRKYGAEVIGPVPTVKKALALIRQSPRIDMALLDIDVAGTSVIPVARALRDRGLPFAFATGFDPKIVPEEFQAVPCWQKPFNLEELARSFEALKIS